MIDYDPTQSEDVQKVLKALAKVYCKFIKAIDFDDELYLRGINEGKNKFLSNAWFLFWKGGKYDKSQFISENALEEIRVKGKKAKLVFEHIVPKSAYQSEIENAAKIKKQDLESYIEDLLNKYWLIATVTVDEDKKLELSKSQDLDVFAKDPFIRYRKLGIRLQPNPEFVLNHDKFAELVSKQYSGLKLSNRKFA